MRDFLVLFVHLVVTTVRLMRADGGIVKLTDPDLWGAISYLVQNCYELGIRTPQVHGQGTSACSKS